MKLQHKRVFIDSTLHHRMIVALNLQPAGKKMDLDRFIHNTLEDACIKLNGQPNTTSPTTTPAHYQTIDPDKLEFPKALASIVGLQSTQISNMKRRGCKFYGKKTTLRWVREFIADNLH